MAVAGSINTLPGGKGPDKATKFVVPAKNLAQQGTPFTFHDWPSLPFVRQAGSIDVAQSLLLTTLAVAATVAQLREPLYHSLPVQPAPFEYRVPNLLTSTLTPTTTAAPFVTEDLSGPLPVTPVPTWQPQRNLLLTAVPFRPVDQTPPLGVRTSFPFEPRNLLVGPLTGQAKPFKPVDFARLDPVRGPVAFDPQNTLVLVPPVQANPFTPVDLGPLQPVAKLGDFAPPNLLTSTLAPPAVATPFTPVDLSGLPKLTRPQDYQPTDLLTGVLLGQVQPFNQLSWPGLTATRLPAEPPAGANLALLTTPAPKPFNQLDWPGLAKPLVPEPFLIPNTTIRQVAPVAPPNLHKLYYDVSSGRLFWRVSETANPIEIMPL